jgi:hypothetical protein
LTNRIPWLRVCVEGGVIVASILLAFSIDAWWSARELGRIEIAMTDALLVEIATNRAELELEVSRLGLGRELIDEFLRATPERLAEVPRDSVRLLLNGFGRGPLLHPRMGSALTLLQTPATDLAGKSVRDWVNRWVQSLDEVEVERNIMVRRREAAQSQLARYSVRSASEGAGVLAEMVARLGPAGLAEMRRDEKVVSVVIELALSQGYYAYRLRELMSLSDSVLVALSRETGSR